MALFYEGRRGTILRETAAKEGGTQGVGVQGRGKEGLYGKGSVAWAADIPMHCREETERSTALTAQHGGEGKLKTNSPKNPLSTA